MKLASYITHPKSLSLSLSSLLITRQKNKEKKLAYLKQRLFDVLSQFKWADGDGEGGGFVVKEFGMIFGGSAAAGGGENRSRAFMMEVARCEGVKECLECEFIFFFSFSFSIPSNLFSARFHITSLFPSFPLTSLP